jgi:hypothetical protein
MNKFRVSLPALSKYDAQVIFQVLNARSMTKDTSIKPRRK